MAEVRTARDRLDRMVTLGLRATRFWMLGASVLVIGTAAAMVFAFTRHRVYKSETLILYRETIRSSDVGGNEAGSDPARKLGLRLKEMVLSRTKLEKIIDEYHLYPDLMADRGYVDAVDEMRNHIAFRVKDGDTFGLGFDGDEPSRTQLVTARLAEALIAENSRHRAEQAEVTKDFIDAEKRRAEEELRDKESALTRFLAQHPEFAKEAQGAASTGLHATENKRAPKSTDPTLLALEREAARIQERLGMPVQHKKPEPNTDPKLVAAQKEAEADLHQAQRELTDKLAQFTEQHPDVRAAKAKVKAAEAKLKHVQDAMTADSAAPKPDKAEDEGVIDRATLESQLAKVNEEINTYKNKKRREAPQPDQPETGAGWIVALETEWSQLNRNVAEARERNQTLQQKLFKASLSENAVASGRNAQMVIVDPAFKPTHPMKPSRSTLALLGVGLALVLSLLSALVAVLLDDRLYDHIDVERLGLVPLVGAVPRAPEPLKDGREGYKRG